MRKKFVLRGEYTEGKKLLVRFVLTKFWRRSKQFKRPPRFYYRLALMRMKGKSQYEVSKILNLSGTGVAQYERRIEWFINHYCQIIERNPIKIGERNGSKK